VIHSVCFIARRFRTSRARRRNKRPIYIDQEAISITENLTNKLYLVVKIATPRYFNLIGKSPLSML
jgi:hypothetical protein